MKKIIYGQEAREKVKSGIDKVADAIAPTLGVIGKTVLIDAGALDPIIADDGATVARFIELEDRYEQMGSRLIRKVTNKMHHKSGDGRSTSTVLARAFVNAAHEEIGTNGHKVREVSERLTTGLVDALRLLTEMKRDVKDEDIEKVATIASLDQEVGKIIAEAFLTVGRDGIVTVEDSTKIGLSLETVKGMRFNKGLISGYLVNEPEKSRTVLENPYILIADRRIATNSQIKNIIEGVLATGSTNILIVALDVEGEALATLILNAQRAALNVACVQAPYKGTQQTDFLQDLAVLTGATVVSEQAGLFLDKSDVSVLGRAEKVVVDRDDTTIINGNSDTDKLEERILMLKNQLEDASEYDRKALQERIAGLSSGIGVIRVGAFTDTELNIKKNKIEDAINSTKLALEEGIVIGGGSALAKVASKMTDTMFKKALRAPIEQMATNAGYSLDVTLDSNDNTGINFLTEKIVDMFDAGIIDPFKVERIALETAISVASTWATIDVVMAEFPEKQRDEE